MARPFELSPYHPIFNGDPPEFTTGDVLGGRYRVLQPLLRGGVGELYAAIHLGNGRRLAVKTHMQRRAKRMEDFARFENEVRFLQSVQSHHNVVEYVDHGALPDGRRRFLVTELLEGGSARWTGPAGRCRVALEVARGLCHIHDRGVIHRDIKPGNISIGDAVKIIDFGIAIERGARAVAGGSRLTREGQAIGTFDYMPPEQFTLAVPEPAADIYALGSTLFQWLANGHTPFGPGTRAELLEAKTTGVPRFLLSFDEHPELIQRCVLDCLHPRVEDRIADAATFIARLESAMRAVGWTSDVTTDDESPRTTARSWSGRAARVSVGLAALASTTFVWLWTDAGREDPRRTERHDAPKPAITRAQLDDADRTRAKVMPRDRTMSTASGDQHKASVSDSLPQDKPLPDVRVPTPHPRRRLSASHPRPHATSSDVTPTRAPPERPEAPPSDCAAMRDAARDALAAFDWETLLVHTERRDCWPAVAEWEHARVLALSESGRFADCVRVGAQSQDDDARFVASMCAAKRKARGE